MSLRRQIVAQYAQHLKEDELAALADATAGMSGRDLRDICEQAERHWAAQVPLFLDIKLPVLQAASVLLLWRMSLAGACHEQLRHH